MLDVVDVLEQAKIEVTDLADPKKIDRLLTDAMIANRVFFQARKIPALRYNIGGIICTDGKHQVDKVKYIREIQCDLRGVSFDSTEVDTSLNNIYGGGFWCAPDEILATCLTPSFRHAARKHKSYWIDMFKQGIIFKNLKHFLLSGHDPCTMRQQLNINVLAAVNLLVYAEREVQKSLNDWLVRISRGQIDELWLDDMLRNGFDLNKWLGDYFRDVPLGKNTIQVCSIFHRAKDEKKFVKRESYGIDSLVFLEKYRSEEIDKSLN